jgi:hypothetical protein
MEFNNTRETSGLASASNEADLQPGDPAYFGRIPQQNQNHINTSNNNTSLTVARNVYSPSQWQRDPAYSRIVGDLIRDDSCEEEVGNLEELTRRIIEFGIVREC